MVSTSESVQVTREGPWLLARFAQRQRVLSWAIVGGGLREADVVAWLEVKNADLPPTVDPRALLEQRMRDYGVGSGVGLLTSRKLDAFVDVTRAAQDLSAAGELSARCVATVGLGNALRAGDAPVALRPVGTINIVCCVSVPLSDEALLEALALASEAKALAVREANVPSFATGELASGTGTDCVVIAAPSIDRELAAHVYAGKHTTLGYLIGAVVHEAVARGAAAWKVEQT